jgi:predicted amidohydrolase
MIFHPTFRLVVLGTLLLATETATRALDREVVVSVYQGECKDGDFAANLAAVRDAVRLARARGSHFVVFPECFLSGYDSRESIQQGARALDDPELSRFIEDSADHEMVVLVGLARRGGKELYNTQLVIQHGKLLGFYDKVMLTPTDRDPFGFTPGRAVPVFQAHGVRFACIICADTSYLHVAMAARLQGAEILFTPHNNEIRADVAENHRRWVRNCHVGLACQLQMVVARANIVKSNRTGWIGYGDSFILSPQGTPLAETHLFRTELITATVTADMFRAPWVWGDVNDVPAWLRTQLGQMLTESEPPVGGN